MSGPAPVLAQKEPPSPSRSAGGTLAPTWELIRRQHGTEAAPGPGGGACACGGGCPSCLDRAGIQPSLLVGALDDPAEREADRIADAIMSGMPARARDNIGMTPGEASIRRCGSTPPEICPCHGNGEEASVARAAASGHSGELDQGGPAPSSVATVLAGDAGRPLEPTLRQGFEASLGADLRDVRVHTGTAAAASAAAIGARAYTHGSDVVFGREGYAPETPTGLRTLAHELAHVVQQQPKAASMPRIRRQGKDAGSASSSSTTRQGDGPGDRVEIRTMTDAEFEALTGVTVSTLPEGRVIAAHTLVGAGIGGSKLTVPSVPYPMNTTGLLVTPAHVSQVAIVNGQTTAYGFRSDLWRHAVSAGEKSKLVQNSPFLQWWLPGEQTHLLNTGRAPAGYMQDTLFQYSPEAVLIHVGDRAPERTADVAKYLEASAPSMEGRPYTFSEPTGRWADEVARRGRVCAAGQNCTTVPKEQISIVTEGRLTTDDLTGGTGKMSKARAVAADEGFLAERGLQRLEIGRSMRLIGVVRAVKGAGQLLLIYGVASTADRILNAPPEHVAEVVTEEASSWGGGWLGATLASAGLGALLCVETGPGALVCSGVLGILGGITGSVVGPELTKDLGHELQGALDTARDPQNWMRAAAVLTGDKQAATALSGPMGREAEGPSWLELVIGRW